jgi:hypothetical protein
MVSAIADFRLEIHIKNSPSAPDEPNAIDLPNLYFNQRSFSASNTSGAI